MDACFIQEREEGGRERMKFESNAANVRLSVYVDVCAYGEPKRHFFIYLVGASFFCLPIPYLVLFSPLVFTTSAHISVMFYY